MVRRYTALRACQMRCNEVDGVDATKGHYAF